MTLASASYASPFSTASAFLRFSISFSRCATFSSCVTPFTVQLGFNSQIYFSIAASSVWKDFMSLLARCSQPSSLVTEDFLNSSFFLLTAIFTFDSCCSFSNSLFAMFSSVAVSLSNLA